LCWSSVSRAQFRAFGAGAARTSNREYHLLSRIPESERSSTGGGGDSPVVYCFLWAPPTLLRNICATDSKSWEFKMINESNDESRYDFIVVGAGAAGSVLAAELLGSRGAVLVFSS